jgi:hypothetical protein
VINEPDEFRVRRRVCRGGRRVTAWVPLRKSVAYLFRYREISFQSNAWYLNALAQVDDPTKGVRALDSFTTRKNTAAARPVKPFHPLFRPDTQLVAALMCGEQALIPRSRRWRVTDFGRRVMSAALELRYRAFPAALAAAA